MDTRRKASSAGLILLGIWLVARMIVVIPIFQEPFRVKLVDTNTYLELANSLLDRGTYEGYSYEDMDLVRTPGYPVFMAAILAVFNRNLAYLAVIQLVLAGGTCALVYWTARQMAGQAAALGAAWFYALNPNSLFVSLTALTETLFTFALTLSLLFLVVYRSKGNLGWAAASAVTLGASALVRPFSVWLIPLWALVVLQARRDEPWRTRLRSALIVPALAWAVFLPWQLRNLEVHGEFTLSTVGETTVRNWMVAEGLAEVRGIPREQAVAEIAAAENPVKYSLRLIARYPRAMAIAAARGVYRTMVGFEYATWMYLLNVDRRPGRAFVNAVLARDLETAWQAGLTLVRQGHIIQLGVTLWALFFDLLLFLSVAAGLVLLWRRYHCLWCLALLAGMAAYLLLVPTGAGQARFRVPAAPALALLGGLSVARIFNHQGAQP